MTAETSTGSKPADEAARRPERNDICDDPVTPPLPPDGGWGWVVVVASLLTNVVVDGVCFSFGIFLDAFVDHFGESRGKTAWVGSLIPGMYLCMGPLVSALANKYGCRNVTMTGSVVAAIFFIISTFSHNVNMLIFTYGVMGGIGFGLMYLPSIIIVGFYFDSHRALATGLAVCGSGVGMFVFAPLADWLLAHYGWQGANWVIAAIILHGVAFGALFRPLKSKPRSCKKPNVRETMIQKIQRERHRRRTVSTGSLDGALITRDNVFIKDEHLIRTILANYEVGAAPPQDNGRKTASVPEGKAHKTCVQTRRHSTKTTVLHSHPPSDIPRSLPLHSPSGGSFLLPFSVVDGTPLGGDQSATASTTSVANTGTSPPQFATNPRVQSLRNSEQASSENDDGGSYSRRDSTSSVTANEGTAVRQRAKRWRGATQREAARPLYRQDIFYSGSVTSIAEYRSTADMTSYLQSYTSMPTPGGDSGAVADCCLPLWAVLVRMLDFTLLKSATFLTVCTASALAMAGFFTPFVYIRDNAIRLGIAENDATMLLPVLGAFNVLGRVVAGWLSDRPWADCLFIHNIALIVAGGATCLVPLMSTHGQLSFYSAVFGCCIAAFITLRSIVLVELLGLHNLTTSFGLMLLFQGIASIVGSPISGSIFDATGSYTVPFVISGCLMGVAGLICLPVRRIACWESRQRGGDGDQTNARSHYIKVDTFLDEIVSVAT